MATRHKSKAASICLTALVAVLAIGISGQDLTGRAGTSRGSQPLASSSANLASLKLGGMKQTATHAAPALDYGKIRLAFEPNVGQAKSDVSFLAHGKGYALFLTGQDAVFALAAHSRDGKDKSAADVVRMKLLGASNTAQLSGDGVRTGTSNYFIGRDPKNWHTDVPNYNSVSVRGVYPGVDLVYYGKQKELEYDFKVAPHADPHVIQMAFEGASNLKVDRDGSLVAAVGENTLRLHAPVAYQIAGSQKQSVVTNYLLQHDGSISLQIGNYDDARELVIDPILAYSTYIGGSNIDGANGIAVAPDGTAFIAGGTFSGDYPTAHPLQPNDGGSHDFPQDAFVAKISADGSTLLYSTYLGGSKTDVGNAIAVDTAGNAYVTGFTDSADFPVTFGAFEVECGGDGQCGATLNNGGRVVSNAFVSKLNPAGSALIYSTFIGEYENVVAYGIAVDTNQIAYITGSVGGYIIPTAASSDIGISLAGAPAGIVEDSTGTSAAITTSAPSGAIIGEYLTTNNVLNTAQGPQFNLDGTAFVTAIVSANTFIADLAAPPGTTGGSGTVVFGPPPFPIVTTTSAAQPNFGGGATNAFVMALSATGTTALYSTYYGGGGEDVGRAIATDGNRKAFITGLTYSPNLRTVNPFLAAPGGGNGDAFVAEFDTTGGGASSLLYASYFGGGNLDQGNAIAYDPSSLDVYIAGGTESTSIVGNPTSVQPRGGQGDAFIAKFNPALTGTNSLVYFTYLGGSLEDIATGVAVDPTGDIFVTGSTVSPDFPTTASIFQPVYGGGNSDAFVTKLDPTATTLLYSSFLGGTNTDIANAIAVDTAGSAYVAGQSCSLDFPLTNPEQAASGGNCDAFVSKVTILSGLMVNPGGLIFPSSSLGSTSQPETVVITNGDTSQTISSITRGGTDPGDFAISANNCVTTLNPGQQCSISVTFAPVAIGTRTANLTIQSSAPNNPLVVTLSGTTSTLTFAPSTLAFGNEPTSVPSAPKAIIVTNNGNTPITMTSIVASGDYSSTDDCVKAALQPSTTCTINVTFNPSAVGPSTGALTITDNAQGSPQVLLLTGTGVASLATVNLSPNSLNFSSQDISTTSAPQAITVTNNGTSALTFTSISASGAFAETNNCTVALQPGTNCAISVTFTPVAAGPANGSITLLDNAPGSQQVVPLQGTGIAGSGDFTLGVTPPSATVSAGQSAMFTVNVTAVPGFTQPVGLTCSGLPAASSCNFSQATVTPNGTTPVPVTVTVNTGLRAILPPAFNVRNDPPSATPKFNVRLFVPWMAIAIALAIFAATRKKRGFALLGLCVATVVLITACNGGGSAGTPAGTPAGTYQITVVGTSGSITHTASFSLQVN